MPPPEGWRPNGLLQQAPFSLQSVLQAPPAFGRLLSEAQTRIGSLGPSTQLRTGPSTRLGAGLTLKAPASVIDARLAYQSRAAGNPLDAVRALQADRLPSGQNSMTFDRALFDKPALSRAQGLNSTNRIDSGPNAGLDGRVNGRMDLLREALGQLGKPYVFGANDFSGDPKAFDCSSFTKWLYERQGISLPRTAQQQFNAVRGISASEAKPGDLVFFRDTYPTPEHVTHVGVVLEGGRMVNAAGRQVRIDSLSDTYWSSRLVGFGRVGGASSPEPRVASAESISTLDVRKMRLDEFPKPPGDNGRGMHWIPTTSSPPAMVDRFVQEAVEMGVRWMVILNNGAEIGANDYLVKRLVANDIMPVMRIWTPNGEQVKGDLTATVRHYKALGVPYFQLFNEPNLNVENPDGRPNVERYVRQWTAAARQVIAGGGLPGFGALAPGGDHDDRDFFPRALSLLRQQAPELIGRTWVSLHNYTFNQPLEHESDSYGFKAFKVYDQMIRDTLGRQLPIIGTEGGAVLGNQFNKGRPAITEQIQAEKVLEIYRYMERQREPYNFAYSNWVIANYAGGGKDAGFERHALFLDDRARPLVSALKDLTAGAA